MEEQRLPTSQLAGNQPQFKLYDSRCMSFINERFCEPCPSAPCPGLPDAAMTRRDYFFVCDGLRTPTLLTTLPALASAFPSALLARLGGLFWLIFFLRSLLVGQNPSALYSPAAAVVFFPVCCGDSIRSYPHNLYIPFPNTHAFSCIPYRRSLDCPRDIGNWLTVKRDASPYLDSSVL